MLTRALLSLCADLYALEPGKLDLIFSHPPDAVFPPIYKIPVFGLAVFVIAAYYLSGDLTFRTIQLNPVIYIEFI